MSPTTTARSGHAEPARRLVPREDDDELPRQGNGVTCGERGVARRQDAYSRAEYAVSIGAPHHPNAWAPTVVVDSFVLLSPRVFAAATIAWCLWRAHAQRTRRAGRRAQPYRLIVNRPVLWPPASFLAPDQYSTTMR